MTSVVLLIPSSRSVLTVEHAERSESDSCMKDKRHRLVNSSGHAAECCVGVFFHTVVDQDALNMMWISSVDPFLIC